jgi:hypothetical protein
MVDLVIDVICISFIIIGLIALVIVLIDVFRGDGDE